MVLEGKTLALFVHNSLSQQRACRQQWLLANRLNSQSNSTWNQEPRLHSVLSGLACHLLSPLSTRRVWIGAPEGRILLAKLFAVAS